MILIGQYDSPFVRRVGIALRLYGLAYAHQPWSTFGDGEKIAPFNPLRRVPTLVLSDGSVVIESAAILDYLDEQAGEGALIPRAREARRAALYICALATGLADKAVSLIYETLLHTETSELWAARCRTQIAAVLEVLEGQYATLETPFWHGQSVGHADIAVVCAVSFVAEAHPDIIDATAWPRLSALVATCEALPVFQAVKQVFSPPPRSR